MFQQAVWYFKVFKMHLCQKQMDNRKKDIVFLKHFSNLRTEISSLLIDNGSFLMIKFLMITN